MRFKTAVVRQEFESDAHPKVLALALYADWWATRFLGHDLLVTDVGRTQGEYDAIYSAKILEGLFFVGADGVKHYAGPRPHLADPLHGVLTHAIDFRTIGEMNAIEVKRLEDHMNAKFPRTDGKPTFLVHNVGQGEHGHLQAQV